MKHSKRFAGLFLAVVFALSIMTSCTQHPNEDEIRAMEEAKTAALEAEKELQTKKSERQKLEEQLRQKQAERDAAKRELEAVKKNVEKIKSEKAE
jgi:septal ring factor EnvC (AmiA/AmiB activator)